MPRVKTTVISKCSGGRSIRVRDLASYLTSEGSQDSIRLVVIKYDQTADFVGSVVLASRPLYAWHVFCGPFSSVGT